MASYSKRLRFTGLMPRASKTRVMSMEIKPIRTEADYEAALAEVEQLWGTEPGTPEGDRFEVLLTSLWKIIAKHKLCD